MKIFETNTVAEYTGTIDPTTRVVTMVPGKEHHVVYKTQHENPVIQSIYEEFKLVKSKVQYLKENRSKLEKFDINVNALILLHS